MSPHQEHDAPNPSEARTARARRRVFLSDDDDDMRALVSHVLIGDGFEVVESKDGLDTLNRLEEAYDGAQGLPDLLILDVLMPHYSGLGVLTALRKAHWSTPVIVMTSFAHESVATRARQLGAIAVFRKPFDMDDFRTAALNASLGHFRAKPVLTFL
jgi:two-component system response regulator (stage 0 sporulation protein F)